MFPIVFPTFLLAEKHNIAIIATIKIAATNEITTIDSFESFFSFFASLPLVLAAALFSAVFPVLSFPLLLSNQLCSNVVLSYFLIQ